MRTLRLHVLSNLSVKSTVLLVLMATSGLVLFLACGAILVHDIALARESLESEARTIARLVGANAVAALEFGDPEDGSALLKSLRSHGDIAAAELIDRHGTVLGRYRYDGLVGTNLPRPDALGMYWEPSRLVSYEPVIWNDEEVGRVLLHINRTSEQETLNRLLTISALVALVGLLVSYVVASFLHRPITRPVESLARVVKSVSDGKDYSIRVERTTDNELGMLTDGFNEMLERIQMRDQALAAYHQELEEEVERRTQELVLTNHDLMEAKDRAEAAARAKSVFLANMSHELRTPMHGILSFARFGINKIERVDRQKLVEYFSQIEQSGSRLLTLLDDLLDLAKLESGKMTFDRREVPLGELLVNVTDEFASLVSERHVHLTLSGDASFNVVLDPDRISQVFRNLLSNALRFSPRDGQIDLTVERRGDEVLMSVKDEGVGIPAGELETIFEKFVQSSFTRSAAGGTGLGLAISREIIAAHEGRIWAENHPKGGAVFWIVIPVAGARIPDPHTDSVLTGVP